METTETKFRNHISIVIERFGTIFIGIVIVLAGSALDDLKEILKHMDNLKEHLADEFAGASLFLVLFLIALFWQLRRWAKTYISIQGQAIVIEKNTWNRKVQTIGIKHISNVNLSQNILEMMLGTCTVKLDTDSFSTADDTDVKLVLKKEKAEWFRQTVFAIMESEGNRSGAEVYAQDANHQTESGAYKEAAGITDEENGKNITETTVTANVNDMIWHGVFAINLFAVLLAVGGIGGSVSKLLSGIQEGISGQNILEIISGWAVAFFIGATAVWDTVKDFIKYYQYQVTRKSDKIYISYGLLKKVSYVIPVKRIHGVTVRQTWIARIFKRYRVELINVGMGDDDEEKDAFFLLYQSHADVIEKMQKLLPEFAEAMELPLQRQKKSVIFLKAISAVIWAVALFVADRFAKEIIGSHFLWINLACVCGWLVVLVMLAGGYVTDAFACDKKSLAVSSGVFGRETTYMHYPQIQYFSVNQNIVAKKLRVVKGNAYLLASASDSRHDLPYMPEEVVEELKEYF